MHHGGTVKAGTKISSIIEFYIFLLKLSLIIFVQVIGFSKEIVDVP